MGKTTRIAGQTAEINAEAKTLYVYLGDVGIVLEDAGDGRVEVLILRHLPGERVREQARHVLAVHPAPAD